VENHLACNRPGIESKVKLPGCGVGDGETIHVDFSPVSELLPEGSSTEEVLQAAADAAAEEGRREILTNKHATKEGYISQVPFPPLSPSYPGSTLHG